MTFLISPGVWGQATNVALKQLQQGDEKAFLREVHTLKLLNHPNIVRFLGVFENGNDHYIVTEYMSAGISLPLPPENSRKPQGRGFCEGGLFESYRIV